MDSTSIENFMITLKVLQEKWDSIEKKLVMSKVISIAFMKGFYTKSQKLSKAQCFLQAYGFTTLNHVNWKEYVPEFYTNDIENVNSQIKSCAYEKLLLDVFIQKMKDLTEFQERQYIGAISGTGVFGFPEKFRYLEIRSV